MKKPLSQMEYEDELMKKHEHIYRKRWDNYPRSIFYYDTPLFDGTTDNVGIYTSETVYSLERA